MSEFEDLATRVLALPSESRAELAELLIQSFDENDELQTNADWLLEIKRRDSEIRSGTAALKPAEQVLREAREQLRCMK